MRKKLFILIFFIIAMVLLFLNSTSSRYIGSNYVVEKVEISNFKKLSEFYERHLNYKELVKKITQNSKTKKQEIIDISTWVYKKIAKISKTDIVIDNHPWTIVERKVGAKDQFSDILSVLLVHNNIDSFFILKFKKKNHPITLFKYNNEWSIIDPYYGVYLKTNDNSFSTIEESKNGSFVMFHLTLGKITNQNLNEIFFDKNFRNILDLNNYYNNLFLEIPSSKIINNTNIYDRGGRSYIQKPIHRIIFQLRIIYKNLINKIQFSKV